MLFLALASLLLGASSGAVIEGTVRAGDSGLPIASVMVSALDQGTTTWTDSAGHYALRSLTPAAHQIRISRLGYQTRTLEVAVAADGLLELDIVLSPMPLQLGQVMVVDRRQSAPDAPADSLPSGDTERAALRIDHARLKNDPAFGEPDVLQALSISPEVVTHPEFPTMLNVRGGGGDQNLVMLDGVPLYNAVHAAGSLSALNPDVVSTVSISRSVASARYGGALSSVVMVSTAEPAGTHLEAAGSLGTRLAGQTLRGPLPGGIGTFVISGRRNTQQLFGGLLNEGGNAMRFGDLFAKGTVHAPRGSLELFSFTSADHVAFDSQVAPPVGDSSLPPQQAAATASAEADLSPDNVFDWRTSTQAAIWRARLDGPARLSMRTWHTRFAANADWAASAGAVHLVSALDHVGVAADASRALTSHFITAGAATDRIATTYRLQGAGARSSGAGKSRPMISADLLSAYLEDEWSPAPRWRLTAGVRGLLIERHGHYVDPRLAVLYAPASRVSLSAGFARTHQYVQSLRNEESVLGSLVGIALPVAAGSGGARVAQSDVLSVAADIHVGGGATLRVGGYARRFDRVLLVALSSAQPFAMARAPHGGGRASGVTTLLDWQGRRASGHVGYAFGTSTRRAENTRYRPSFAASHAFNMALGFTPAPGTTLRAALWTSSGRPTSAILGDFQWEPAGLLGGINDAAGTPERIAGALNGERLPTYARLDLGARHEWRIEVNGTPAGITGVVNLSNALNRSNVLARTLSPDGRTRRDIHMLPRSVTLGLEWRY